MGIFLGAIRLEGQRKLLTWLDVDLSPARNPKVFECSVLIVMDELFCVCCVRDKPGRQAGSRSRNSIVRNLFLTHLRIGFHTSWVKG